MLVSGLDERAKPVLRHEREGSSGKLDPVDVFAPIREQLVNVRLRDGGIVGPADLGEPFGARCFGLERVGWEEGERVGAGAGAVGEAGGAVEGSRGGNLNFASTSPRTEVLAEGLRKDCAGKHDGKLWIGMC